ncbi:hypothetical protein SBA3_1960025 [Candidatus Sulfopaludibacter sp. SbA3]|nr:hypothetical protein SBA3_1960025 [Candidatus Sulfopaludibacter sp. SbA3]
MGRGCWVRLAWRAAGPLLAVSVRKPFAWSTQVTNAELPGALSTPRTIGDSMMVGLHSSGKSRCP